MSFKAFILSARLFQMGEERASYASVNSKPVIVIPPIHHSDIHLIYRRGVWSELASLVSSSVAAFCVALDEGLLT